MYVPYTAYGLLGILAVLIMAGVLQRVFDKMRMPSWLALVLVIGVLGLAFIPNIALGGGFAFNIGGWLVPMGVAVYLMIKVGFNRQMANAWIASGITAGAVYILRYFIPVDTRAMEVLAAIVIGLIAGAVSYLLGRSRRGAFVSAVFGLTIGETAVFLTRMWQGAAPALTLGGAGMFDSIVIAAVSAVLLAELVGATEKGKGGTAGAVKARRAASAEAGEDYGKK